MPTSPRRANLTLDKRIAAIVALSSFLRDGVMQCGAVKATAEHFRCHRHTIQTVWKRHVESSDTAINLAYLMAKTVGRHPKRSQEEIIAAIGQSGGVRKYNSQVKPFLTPANKKQRCEFALSIVNPVAMRFNSMYDRGFVDEKWFYLTKVKKRYYVTANENDVQRAVKSKHYIPKIIFIVAVARPRYDIARARWFSGKLGIWPFTVKNPAERASKNRPAGTMVTKAVNVTKEVYRQALLMHVLPAIKEQWSSKNTPIIIQQDNARPHESPMDTAVVPARNSEGWDIGLQFQSPNSPDLNILDLGFFKSMQAIQHQRQPNNLDELIACISKAFGQLHNETLDNVFLTMRSVMQELLKNHGGNQLKIPRMSKAKKKKKKQAS